jgi:hypothetical protein
MKLKNTRAAPLNTPRTCTDTHSHKHKQLIHNLRPGPCGAAKDHLGLLLLLLMSVRLNDLMQWLLLPF